MDPLYRVQIQVGVIASFNRIGGAEVRACKPNGSLFENPSQCSKDGEGRCRLKGEAQINELRTYLKMHFRSGKNDTQI